MKPETYLNAMVEAIQDYYKVKYDIPYLEKRLRQARAFRAHILRMFEDAESAYFKGVESGLETLEKEIADNRKKDKRIAELEEEKAMETYRYVELASVNDRLEKRIAELEKKIGKLYLEKYA